MSGSRRRFLKSANVIFSKQKPDFGWYDNGEHQVSYAKP